MGNPIPSKDAREAAAEHFQFGNFALAETETSRAIKDGEWDYHPLVQTIARFEAQIRADAYEQAAKWLRSDAKLCDCFARSSGECGCGAWDDHKTVAMSDLINRFEQEFALSDHERK